MAIINVAPLFVVCLHESLFLLPPPPPPPPPLCSFCPFCFLPGSPSRSNNPTTNVQLLQSATDCTRLHFSALIAEHRRSGIPKPCRPLACFQHITTPTSYYAMIKDITPFDRVGNGSDPNATLWSSSNNGFDGSINHVNAVSSMATIAWMDYILRLE